MQPLQTNCARVTAPKTSYNEHDEEAGGGGVLSDSRSLRARIVTCSLFGQILLRRCLDGCGNTEDYCRAGVRE